MTITKKQLNAVMTDFIVRSLELRADRVRERHEANAKGIAKLYHALHSGATTIESGMRTPLGGVTMDFGSLDEVRKQIAEDEERASNQLDTIAQCEDAIRRLRTAGARLTEANKRVIVRTVELRKKRALHMLDGFRRVLAGLEKDVKKPSNDIKLIEENLERHRRIVRQRDEVIVRANEFLRMV